MPTDTQRSLHGSPGTDSDGSARTRARRVAWLTSTRKPRTPGSPAAHRERIEVGEASELLRRVMDRTARLDASTIPSTSDPAPLVGLTSTSGTRRTRLRGVRSSGPCLRLAGPASPGPRARALPRSTRQRRPLRARRAATEPCNARRAGGERPQAPRVLHTRRPPVRRPAAKPTARE